MLLAPFNERTTSNGMTYGLGPSGYDLRLNLGAREEHWLSPGQFMLASAREHFVMPADLIGVVHDKSTLVRQGLCVQNTIIEPGWRGFLTLELVLHGHTNMRLVNGQPICQVVFHLLDQPAETPYAGKYQDQVAGPVGAIHE
jgi:dCTP deaminase